MKALFSIFSLTALLLQFAGSARGDNFKASLSPLLIVRAQLANGEFVCAQKFPNLVEAQFYPHNGAGVRLPPPPCPVIKEFHRGNIFFPRRKYRGNIIGKYCPQSPIIGPFANLFSHGSVFAQSTKGGEEKRVVVGIPKIILNCKCAGKKQMLAGLGCVC